MPPEQPEQPPTFQFEGFAFEHVSLETSPKTPLAEGETLQPGIVCNLAPKGSIEIDHDRKRAEVMLGFRITADPKKQPYVVDVTIVGRFSLKAGAIEHLEQFAKGGAASVLFPFVRQMVYTITRDARWGPLLINPINVQTMLKWQEDQPEEVSDSNEPSPPPSQSRASSPDSGS